MEKKRIVILGAGYGGLRTLKKLQGLKPNAEIIIVNKNDYHCETTSLHEVAAGRTEANKICYPVSYVVNPRLATFIQDAVIRVNTDDQTVALEKQGDISYDYLLIALGFESESFGVEGVNEYAFPISDIPSVEKIRRHIETQFEKWQDSQKDELLTIVVGGAGFTSFEFLGELTNQLPSLLNRYHVPREKVRIVCIEASPEVLPMFDRKLANYGTEKLEKRGVEFVVGRVTKVTPDRIFYKNEDALSEIKTTTLIWGAGVRGSSVIKASGFEEKRGRVMVNDDLTVPGHKNILIIGDCSAVNDPATNRPYPTSAQIAMQQADCAAVNLKSLVDGQPLKKFEYKPKGTVCSLGNNDAMGSVMGKNLKGYPASVLKKVIDDRSLVKIGGVETLLKKGKFDFYQ